MFRDEKKNINDTDLHTWNQYVRGNFIIIKKNLVKKKTNDIYSNSLDKKNTKDLKRNDIKSKKRLLLKENNYFIEKKTDKKTLQKIKKYKIRPDKILDLHGKTKYEGKTLVIKFIHDSYINNKRFLLIITGKGSSFSFNDSFSEKKPGILRRTFPEWLKNELISSFILNYTSAHNYNGGEGAYYVFLKKNKSL